MGSMSPDERVFRNHIVGPRFIDGVAAGRWRIARGIDWPHVLIAVSARARDNSPGEFFLYFDLSGYPASAPTAGLWDPTRNAVLSPELRPKGERVGGLFRSDWEGGAALYAPFDRVALQSHPEWTREHPRRSWDAKKDLAWILQYIYELLHDVDYTGV